MRKSALAVAVACVMSGAASAQDIMPDPQKIDAMTRHCVFNSAFYSQGAIICIGPLRGLQCASGNWVSSQDQNNPANSACKDFVPTSPRE